ncbi:hypothetical protein JZ751_029720 [Albula glossodonta]|uniref:Uncharacterized protein n=1 Tax=Albula glossodonta TaxID=121402 RepID=A0A8T2N9Z6_9TELE|nr:hypothetical protein JZ751_029720 [Albula glossodonta]
MVLNSMDNTDISDSVFVSLSLSLSLLDSYSTFSTSLSNSLSMSAPVFLFSFPLSNSLTFSLSLSPPVSLSVPRSTVCFAVIPLSPSLSLVPPPPPTKVTGVKRAGGNGPVWAEP